MCERSSSANKEQVYRKDRSTRSEYMNWNIIKCKLLISYKIFTIKGGETASFVVEAASVVVFVLLR